MHVADSDWIWIVGNGHWVIEKSNNNPWTPFCNLQSFSFYGQAYGESQHLKLT